jgi:hypothetical protein
MGFGTGLIGRALVAVGAWHSRAIYPATKRMNEPGGWPLNNEAKFIICPFRARKQARNREGTDSDCRRGGATRPPIRKHHGVYKELQEHAYIKPPPPLVPPPKLTPPPKWSRIAIALTSTVILLAVNARTDKLHCNYGYSIIYINLSITRTSASPLPPGTKAWSMSCNLAMYIL